MRLPSPFALKIFSKAGEERSQGSSMNSLRSALTALLPGLPDPYIRAKGDYECGRLRIVISKKVYTMSSVRSVYYVSVLTETHLDTCSPR